VIGESLPAQAAPLMRNETRESRQVIADQTDDFDDGE
jgi:hypothetical protein